MESGYTLENRSFVFKRHDVLIRVVTVCVVGGWGMDSAFL
jgi:hypothetical protein